MDEEKELALRKYAELYEHSKVVLAEELARSHRADEKASKYLTALSLVLGALVWFWLDSLKAREAGVDAARRACLREAVQFLDETVVGHGLRLARDGHGHIVLRRAFEFEYSVSGDDRYAGSVVLEGREVVLVDVTAHRLAQRAVVVNLH